MASVQEYADQQTNALQNANEILKLERDKAVELLKLGVFEDARDRRAVNEFLNSLNARGKEGGE